MADMFIIVGLAVAVVLQAMSLFKNHSSAQLAALKDFLYSLVLQAEAAWGGGTGEAKRALVVQLFYEKAPNFFKQLVKPDKLIEFIEDAVTRMKTDFEKNPPAAERIVGGDSDGEN